jgi:hypothetical protein
MSDIFAAGLPDGVFFIPKIQIWIHIGETWNGKIWYTNIIYH